MLRTLFWNVKAKQLGEYIGELCDEHEIDVVVVAEPPSDTTSLLIDINGSQESATFVSSFSPGPRFTLFTRLPSSNITLILDDDGLLIREVSTILGQKIFFCAVHLPSKMHFSNSDQAAHATTVVEKIKAAQARTGNDNVLIVGDFNMNPFDAGMVGANAFHATGDRRIAAKGGRRVQGAYYPYLYNPMWSFLGDISPGPPGTHYFGSPGYTGLHWNMLDQVLLSPALLKMFKSDEVKVISATSTKSLMCSNEFRPKISDHFPIVVGLR